MKRYEVDAGGTYVVDDDGERTQIANFWAKITREVRYIDGEEVDTFVTVAGGKGEGKNSVSFPEVELPAATFMSMGWVMGKWGVAAVIQPGGGAKDDLRTAIQLASTPSITTVFKHLGWARPGGKLVYLHAGGGIGEKGNDPEIKVSLPADLAGYNMAKAVDVKQGIRATVELLNVAPTKITWPLLAGTLTPLFGPVDFAIHLTGRTGTFKSELMSLFISHYGPEMDARHLPGSWSSTANALEAQAFIAKNAAFVIDDFVPHGTTWQQRQYQATADKIIRSQGNQAGRARLTDVSGLQTTMYPRGVILSTGEDTPEGHSVRARMLILEISPGEIEPGNLTKAQANRSKYTGTTVGLIQELAKTKQDIRPRAKEIRDQTISVGHSRTPSMLGRLAATAEAFLGWAKKVGEITATEMESMKAMALTEIFHAGEQQNQYLEQQDPVEQWQAAIRGVLGQKAAHIRTLNGGVPRKAEMLGWTNGDSNSEVPVWRSHGPCMGWIDWEADEMLIEQTAGFAIVRKMMGAEMPLSKATLMKRLKEAGQLTRTDDARQRNTVRVTAEEHPRTVIAIPISSTLQTEETA